MAPPKNPEEIEIFRNFLRQRSLKLTSERDAILRSALSLKGHFDADSFFALIKKQHPRIARDTVYRNLPLLLESGILQKSVGDERREYFERTSSKGHHDHLLCVSCRDVVEFVSPEIERVQQRVCKELGFELLFHDHRLFGKCRKCQDA